MATTTGQTNGTSCGGESQPQAQIVIATAEQATATAATLSEPTTAAATLALAPPPDAPDYPAPIVEKLRRGRYLLNERRLLDQARREEIEAEEAARQEAEKKRKDAAWTHLKREIVFWFGLDLAPWVHAGYADFTADAKEHVAFVRFGRAAEIACKFVKVDERGWEVEPWVKRPAHAEQALFRVTAAGGQRYEYCHEDGMALARAVEVWQEEEQAAARVADDARKAASASRVLAPEQMVVEGMRLLVVKMMAESGLLAGV